MLIYKFNNIMNKHNALLFILSKLENVLVNLIQRNICCLAMSPEGSRVATGESGKDPCVRIWDKETKQCTAKLKSHRFQIVNLAWHPDGKHIVSCGNIHDRQVK